MGWGGEGGTDMNEKEKKEGWLEALIAKGRKETAKTIWDGEGVRLAGARGGWLSGGKGRATQDNKTWGSSGGRGEKARRGGRHRVEQGEKGPDRGGLTYGQVFFLAVWHFWHFFSLYSPFFFCKKSAPSTAVGVRDFLGISWLFLGPGGGMLGFPLWASLSHAFRVDRFFLFFFLRSLPFWKLRPACDGETEGPFVACFFLDVLLFVGPLFC